MASRVTGAAPHQPCSVVAAVAIGPVLLFPIATSNSGSACKLDPQGRLKGFRKAARTPLDYEGLRTS